MGTLAISEQEFSDMNDNFRVVKERGEFTVEYWKNFNLTRWTRLKELHVSTHTLHDVYSKDVACLSVLSVVYF